jgi:hypothetical protein
VHRNKIGGDQQPEGTTEVDAFERPSQARKDNVSAKVSATELASEINVAT